MFEHEAESDEDCEVYFLKPVNEYNIVDKIKEANKELFADDDEEPEGPLVDSGEFAAVNRKVTFALNLEDYEPTTGASKTLEANDQKEDDEDEGVDVVVNDMEAHMQSTVIKCTTIIEEPLLEVEAIAVESEIDSSLIDHTTLVDDSPNNIEEVASKMEEVCVVAEDEDEICEEIIVTDMDCEKAEEEIVPGHRIVKQNTFDYDEQDNKSMTNLLPSSDCEYEADDTLNDDNDGDDDALDETFPNTFDIDDDDDDDDINGYDDDANENDDLSIIVASYLTDDMFMENVKTKKNNKSPNNYSTMKKLPSFSITSDNQESKQNRFFSTKRFSLRRKLSNNKSQDEEQVRGIKLSYKTCCEYRNSKQEKLPKYTGYLSEYGLSHDQLMRRDDQYRRKQRYVLEQTLKSNEDDLKKMQDNERAFTRWLKNKMRYPINKTRNMFDAKLRSRNSIAGTCSGGMSGHECMSSTRYK